VIVIVIVQGTLYLATEALITRYASFTTRFTCVATLAGPPGTIKWLNSLVALPDMSSECITAAEAPVRVK
jgi:hypothetical protein